MPLHQMEITTKDCSVLARFSFSPRRPRLLSGTRSSRGYRGSRIRGVIDRGSSEIRPGKQCRRSVNRFLVAKIPLSPLRTVNHRRGSRYRRYIRSLRSFPRELWGLTELIVPMSVNGDETLRKLVPLRTDLSPRLAIVSENYLLPRKDVLARRRRVSLTKATGVGRVGVFAREKLKAESKRICPGRL